jgi:hypothetical protein
MPEIGLRRTVWAGAALNGVVFALAALLARGAADPPTPEGPRAAPSPAVGAPPTWILPAIALSGAVSFAYEVLWTRLLGHLLGASVDAFASMLDGFLLGIALGSALAASLATSRERAAVGFGVSQLGIAFSAYAVFALAGQLPELSVGLGACPTSSRQPCAGGRHATSDRALDQGDVPAVRLLAGGRSKPPGRQRGCMPNTVGATPAPWAPASCCCPGWAGGRERRRRGEDLALAACSAPRRDQRRTPVAVLAARRDWRSSRCRRARVRS